MGGCLRLSLALKHTKRGVNRMADFYWFTFEDGYRVCVRGFSKQELAVEEKKHGRVVRKERAI